MNQYKLAFIKYITGFAIVFALIIGFSSFFITPEGHVDVVKRFGKAISIAQP